MLYEQVGVIPANLLLPREGVHPTAWACVACDQYTSQPEYWQEAALQVGDAPSALKLILPECFLSEAAERVPAIQQTMRQYLTDGTLLEQVHDGFVLVERATGSGERVGLVCAVDLEQYDYTPGSLSLVRPTEETIRSRLPARLAVRNGAPLEVSHILLLMDDPLQTVVEPLYARRERLRKLYDFPLMMNGGALRGWAVTSEEDKAAILGALTALRDAQGNHPLLFAVGDGNHSLATAKACWESLKLVLSPEEQAHHPCRYAMCEIENIHDDALTFEPIHRVVAGVNPAALMQDWTVYCHERCMDLSEVTGQGGCEHVMRVVYGGCEAVAAVTNPDGTMPADTLQRYLDDYLRRHPEARMDYIHGEDVVRRLCQAPDTIGFLLPALDKADFFPTLQRVGVMPRKTFSLGEAHEKRFYMEARRIVP